MFSSSLPCSINYVKAGEFVTTPPNRWDFFLDRKPCAGGGMSVENKEASLEEADRPAP
jgi:hypothetical protein